MFGRTHSFGTDEIPVTVCHTADDVRRTVRRNVPRVPVVNFPCVQEAIHIEPVVVNCAPEIRIPVVNQAIEPVLFEVCEKHGVSYDELVGPRRIVKFVHARHEAMYRLRVEAKISLPHIGRMFHRDHTTVGYGIAAHVHRNNLPMPDDMGPNWRIGLRWQRGTL